MRDPLGELALQREAAELAALTRVAEAVATAPSVEAFLSRASAEIALVVGCDVVAFFVVDRERRGVQLLHFHGGGREDWERAATVPADGSGVADAGLRAGASVRQEAEFGESTREALARIGVKTVASVPVRFQSQVVAVLTAGFRQPRPEEECRTDLLLAIGAHVAAAIQTHRLLDDLRGRVSELTLLNDIAVASATLDPVLLVENALRRISSTFRAEAACAHVVEGDELVQLACLGLGPDAAARTHRMPLALGPAGRAIAERRALQAQQADPGDAAAAWTVGADGTRSIAAVPLLVKDRALGVLLLGRRRDERFSDGEMSLLSAIGVQLGIAVENARLFADTRRRLADLEAVNSLAVRMLDAAPGDLQALLEATARDVARALSARSALVLQLDEAGAQLTGVAGFGVPLPPGAVCVPLARSELARRVLRTQQPAAGAELLEDHLPDEPAQPPLSLLLVPLTSRRATRGVLAVGDSADRRFTDADVALASALASLAAIGMENASLYAEERQRVEQLSVLNDVGRAVAASLDLDRILGDGARAANRLVGSSHCHVLLVDRETQTLRVAASTAGLGRLGEITLPIAPTSAAARALAERRPIAVELARGDPGVDQRLAELLGVDSLLATPLFARDEPLGALVLSQHGRTRRFTAAEIERAGAVANQLAVAIDNSRLYENLRRSYAELAEAQERLVRQARLAALGEMAAIVAHEVRNPLGVIFNSVGRLRRHVHSDGDARLLLDMVGEEADRLNRIVGDLLDFAKPAPPSFRLEPLDRVVDDAVAAALGDEAPAVEVVRHVPADLPLVPMDARLIRQAIVNVAVNATQAMPGGGRLVVRVRLEGDSAVVELGDTGPGFPPEAKARLFEPFFTTKATGTGLGLAVVKRIVDDHRGRIEVRDADGGGTVFELHLPLAATAPERVEMPPRMGRGSRA